MYKDKVDSEEYLTGRRIDSSALNDPEPTTQGWWHYVNSCAVVHCFCVWLWPPYVMGQTIIFLPCGFYLSILLSFFLA